MKRFANLFNNHVVTSLADPGVILFNVDDIAQAVGYSKPGSVIFHVKKRIKIVGGVRYIDLKAINLLAKRATRTPTVKEFAAWAKTVHDKELALQQAAAHIAKQKKPESSACPFSANKTEQLHNVEEAATKLGMKSRELADWLVSEGYASRYASNGNLKLSKWFKEQSYGMLPLAASGKVSNTPRITESGLEFIRNRLKSQRESNVLSFAVTNANEREKLEKEITNLIRNTFSSTVYDKGYSGCFGDSTEYRMYDYELQRKVREVIAQVKLKELNK